jgi:uncharacterized protein (DUF58 family)
MNYVWFMLVTAALIVLQQQYYARRGMRGVSYSREFSKATVHEGEQVELIELLENRKLAPLPWVRVESRVSFFLKFAAQDNLDMIGETMYVFFKSIFFLRGYRQVRRRHKVTCTRRGVYDLKQSFVTVGDLFSQAGTSAEFLHDATLHVYPRLLSPNEMPPALNRFQGDISVRRFIQPDPVLVAGIRGYLPGDPQRDIHWRATARSGQLQVKVRDYTISPRLLVVLNVQPAEDIWSLAEADQIEDMERNVRIAATLCAEGIRAGLDVGFLCNGQYADDKTAEVSLPSRPSEHHLDSILLAMSRLLLQRRVELRQLLDHELDGGLTGYDVVILSAYWNEDLEERAVRLRRQGNAVTVVDV